MDQVPNTLTILKESHVVWNWSYDHEYCIHIPFVGKKCVTINVGISILESDGKYSVEVQFMGHHASVALFSGCHTVVSVSVGHLEICLTPDVQSGSLKGFDIKVKACVGILGIDKCFDLYSKHIVVTTLAELPREMLDHPAFAGLKASDPGAPKYIAFEI